MTALRVLLQSARLPLFQSGLSSALDVKAWLANQNYYFSQDISGASFVLRASDPEQLKQALANDLNRLASAAFESAAGIAPDPVLPRSLAWGSVRSYYSAFFAAHAFMRLFGKACIQLDKEHVDQVLNAAQVMGRSGGLTALDSGFFAATIDPNFENVTFSRLKDSHRDTWATLVTVIEELEMSLPSTTALSSHKVEASALLSNLKGQLTRSGSTKGNWLSTMRNSINYRQSHGTWFPYSKLADPAMLESAARAWKSHPSSGANTVQSELDCFFQASIGLVALVRELTSAAAALNSPLNPIFVNGCLKLLNEAKKPRSATTRQP
ncbi:hypothetical protein [Acidovorax sp. Root70]|uniref:hypothetical protein n=1 Tax=Acidovorax sp. Root70 TaxID=1736590 RepID=UPI000AF95B3A|nr:hypothetical protein [Acidovorax sp. Root70]